MRKNQIDVIIPTYRPDERVVLLVRRLLKQSRRPDHIYPVSYTHLDVYKRQF